MIIIIKTTIIITLIIIITKLSLAALYTRIIYSISFSFISFLFFISFFFPQFFIDVVVFLNKHLLLSKICVLICTESTKIVKANIVLHVLKQLSTRPMRCITAVMNRPENNFQLSDGHWKFNFLRVCISFAGKHLCRSLFFCKVPNLQPATLL